MDDVDAQYSLLAHADNDYGYSDREEVKIHTSRRHNSVRFHRQTTLRCYNMYKQCTCLVGTGAALLIILVITCAVIGLFYASKTSALLEDAALPSRHDEKSSDPSPFSDWELEISLTGSEAPLRVVDVNGDGMLDVLLGLTYNRQAYPVEPEHCKQYQARGGCAGGIIAVDGRDGHILWRIHTKDEVFELRCPAIDVDLDGDLDCIGSGRHGTLLAFNPQSGRVIWSMPSSVNELWNVFGPAFVVDLDKDGVEDMVIVNGGDTRYTAEEHNRTGSCLLVLSSRTGEMIGSRVFSIPDGKESYSLPVTYNGSDGSQYIVFGSGGETVSGGLYILSLGDLLSYVDPHNVYSLRGGYDMWANTGNSRSSLGVITLYETESKGVMVPVSLVDLTNDGVNDIICLTFDGILLAVSGEDLQFIWEPKNFTIGDVSTESYASPGFGYFNEDQTPDIMVSWQTGSWPTYDSLMVYIIDGRDGVLLWFKDTPAAYDYTISPPITLATSLPYRDGFIYRLSSTNMPFHKGSRASSQKIRATRGMGDKSHLLKRHIGGHTGGRLPSCDDVKDAYTDTFIMDRSNMNSPFKLYTQHSQSYYYTPIDHIVTMMVAEDSPAGREPEVPSVEVHGRPNLAPHGADVTEDMIQTYIAMSSSATSKSKHPTGRRRRHGNEDDAVIGNFSHILNTQRCARFNPRDSSAGILTDLDADGTLDYISVDVAFATLTLTDTVVSGDVMLKTVIRKFSLGNVLPLLPPVALDEVVVTFTPSASDLPLQNLSLSDLTSQRWPQHLGKGQDGVY